MNQFRSLLQKHTGGRSRKRLRKRSTDTAVHARTALGKSTSSCSSNWQGMKSNNQQQKAGWAKSAPSAPWDRGPGSNGKNSHTQYLFALLFTGKVHPQASQSPEPSSRVCWSRVIPKRGRWSSEPLQETGNTQVHGTRWEVSEGPEITLETSYSPLKGHLYEPQC